MYVSSLFKANYLLFNLPQLSTIRKENKNYELNCYLKENNQKFSSLNLCLSKKSF